MVTLAMLGVLLATVIEAPTGSPVVMPSPGVTVHTTSLPRVKPPESVSPVPAGVPSMDQAMVETSASPSTSSKPV